ncbi:sensor histidine kinase [Clostridium fessum]|uniref:sensor histidine kinase n=1 Tax=Clostridium fessum TaxID=2126740 RepID=UPI00399B0872
MLGTLFAYLFMADRQKNLLEEIHNASLNQALEMEKEASKKALEAGKVKSIFLANMSHDIRTPINAILGFADIIDRHPDDEARVRDCVGKIKTSGHILLSLINDVLDLTKIENDKLQLNEAPAYLTKMAQKLNELFHPVMKQGELDFDIQLNLPHPHVLCDEGKLQRILVNVINNEVKFTPKGGQIRLSITDHLSDDNSELYEFLVQDTGIGISKEFLSHIFEAFEQEPNTAVNNSSGAGLGLSIVKKLVDLMNGMVVIDSTPGNGTSVKIMLPLSRAEMDLNSRNTGKSPVSAALSGIQPRIMSLTLRSPGRFWKKKAPKSPGQPMERKPWTASSTLQSAFSILF